MTIRDITDAAAWDAFLASEPWSPFLQSFAMGKVYEAVQQKAVRIAVEDAGQIIGIAFGHVVPARRGRHIAVPYGPVIADALPVERKKEVAKHLVQGLYDAAKKHGCTFLRLSPWQEAESEPLTMGIPSPLHLLAEHVWYLPLSGKTEEELLAGMRKTTRNLIGRAERDGVTVEASVNPTADIEHFLKLHDETRKRHGFTPYTNTFFRAQVETFAPSNHCTVYLARHEGRVIASSIHMHMFGETSYHHGASEHSKVPASYLLQWRAIQDALKRGDQVYNFWGIAPTSTDQEGNTIITKKHPFSGVTLFKTGFGGTLLNLQHCHDIPISLLYWKTFAIELVRKWRRGF
ncbi:MAG: peptidoglycan bridge formation glycyltransferase FemA/FemB family protein [Candidatus Peribacteraceae bacterium]